MKKTLQWSMKADYQHDTMSLKSCSANKNFTFDESLACEEEEDREQMCELDDISRFHNNYNGYLEEGRMDNLVLCSGKNATIK